jgi:hypothetical protein
MRTVLKAGSFAVVLSGMLLAMSLPAAGRIQARTVVRPASGPFPSGLRPNVTASSSFHILFGVYCTSAKNCWSVGQQSSGNALLNQILHWNGKSWQQSKTPDPGGTKGFADNELFAVRCLSAKDCWAVGEYLKGNHWLGEALHWTGKKWLSTAVPAYGGTAKGNATELFDSACTAANNCWAVGDFGLGNNPPKKLLNLVLHWNGKKWSRLRVPNPGGTKMTSLNYIDAVRCVSAANCNAVGAYGSVPSDKDIYLNEVLHWNGKRWSWVHVPNLAGTSSGDDNQLVALGCGATTSCWGAGYYGQNEPTQTFRNGMLHWNGKKWTTVKVPNPGGTAMGETNFIFGVTCDGSGNCWAVGEYRNSHGSVVNEALHWNGKRWYLVGTPNPAGSGFLNLNTLYAVRCTSSANCWAVGGALPKGGYMGNEILHWNGKKWSVWPA